MIETLDLKETMEFLRVKKKSTMYKKIKREEIPHYKCGKQLLFSKTKLEQWLEEREIQYGNRPMSA